MDAFKKMELLAPAGGPEALRAAIEAGADAVYFGLKELNARRGAENFNQENIVHNVNYVHSKNARAYLALNIDISQRELGEAARHLELARQSKIDAVLIKDPSLIKLIPFYPELEFHFSTQAGISSSAGVMAARELGIKRVVLAREMSLDEIRAASSVEGVETEVFVQGALCFSMSGRCMLSSWIGGRSGNRGLCASPCRFEWKIGDSGAGRFLSMYDLSLLDRLDDLSKAGVRALKIEGRLKSPEWISKAVSIYRKALDTGVSDELRAEVESLGEYTGRKFTEGYLGACRSGMTGDSGRPPKVDERREGVSSVNIEAADSDEGFGMDLKIEDGRLSCVFSSCGVNKKYIYPLSVARSQDRSLSLKQIGEYFSGELVHGLPLARFNAEAPDIILQKGILRKIENDLSSFIHLSKKRKTDEKLKIKLPLEIQTILDLARTDLKTGPNRKQFNGTIDIFRISGYAKACEFRKRNPRGRIIIDGVVARELADSAFGWGTNPCIIALPPVFFEKDVLEIEELLKICLSKGYVVEVNNWDGWFLARQAGVRLIGGAGLSVLNSLAAGFLQEHGCSSVTVSLEADGQQVGEMAPKSTVPLIFYVYGKPALMISRVEFPGESYGKVFAERRNCRIKLEREFGLSVFRPESPYDLRNIVKGRIAVADFAAEVPQGLTTLPSPSENPATFNYVGRLR